MARKAHRVSKSDVELLADKYIAAPSGKKPSARGKPRTGRKPGPARTKGASRRKSASRPDSATLIQMQADRAQSAAATRVGSSMELRQAAFLDVIRMGWSFAKACDDVGVSRTTAYRWKEDDSEGGFKERYEDALTEAKERLVDIVFKRATQDDAETGRQSSDVLLMFATKARLPEFRDNHRTETSVNVNVGVPMAMFEQAAEMIRARYIEAERNRLAKAAAQGITGPLPIIDLTPDTITATQEALPAKSVEPAVAELAEQAERTRRDVELRAIRLQAAGVDVSELQREVEV